MCGGSEPVRYAEAAGDELLEVQSTVMRVTEAAAQSSVSSPQRRLAAPLRPALAPYALGSLSLTQTVQTFYSSPSVRVNPTGYEH